MKKIFLAATLVLAFSATVFAAPFLISDPYPTTTTQPDKFVVVWNGTTYDITPEAVTGSGVRLHWDIAGKWQPGTNSLTVKAVNMWGSSATVPFSFTAGVPTLPENVSLSAQ